MNIFSAYGNCQNQHKKKTEIKFVQKRVLSNRIQNCDWKIADVNITHWLAVACFYSVFMV